MSDCELSVRFNKFHCKSVNLETEDIFSSGGSKDTIERVKDETSLSRRFYSTTFLRRFFSSCSISFLSTLIDAALARFVLCLHLFANVTKLGT